MKQADFDIVILDVMLRRVTSHPVAAFLRTLGRSFIVTTGFNQGMLDGDFIGAPVLSKPFTIEQLADVLSLVAPRDQSS